MKISNQLSLLAVASTLAACGGGGGGVDPSLPGPVTTPVVVNSVALQTSVPPATYSAGSDQLLAFNYLNKMRSTCGFGLVKQNTMLDQAAKNHTVYMVENPIGDPHWETEGLAGFTAKYPTDRARLVGYTSKGPEVLENGVSKWSGSNLDLLPPVTATTEFTEGTRTLLQAPYHAINGMLTPIVEVGSALSLKETVSAQNGTSRWQELKSSYYISFGYGDSLNGQLPASNSGIRTYPCEGSDDSLPIFADEYSAGVPIIPESRNLSVNPIGAPIMIIGEYGKTLEITSASLIQVSNNFSVPVYAVRTKANDPNAFYYRNDWSGYIFFDKPLVPNQVYRATITGKSGGMPFSRQFTYKVGNYLNQAQNDYAIRLGLPVR